VKEKLKAKAEAGDELEVVARLGGYLEAGVCDEKGLRVAPSEADDRVAEVEAREDAARRVELQDAAHVRREVRPAPLAEDGSYELLVAEERDGVCADERVDAAEGDEAGARFGEDAEASEAPTDLRAELHLRGEAARRAVGRALARVEVALGFEREIFVDVVADATAEARF